MSWEGESFDSEKQGIRSNRGEECEAPVEPKLGGGCERKGWWGREERG